MTSLSLPSIPPGARYVPLVIAPTFNHASRLIEVLDRLKDLGLEVLVVNDGSTDKTATLLRSSPFRVITHEHNQGKANALYSGFVAAAELGYTHAATIDTDGQHEPADVLKLLEVSQANPEAIVLGQRDASAPNYPGASRVGRWASNVLVRLESGLRVSDSQCGLRVYPIAPLLELDCKPKQRGAGHYGWETEILTRWGWAGREVVQEKITCVYFLGDQRISHFKPWVDSLRAAAMHQRLLTLAMARWFNPLVPFRQLREAQARGVTGAENGLALAVACGVFIACIPLYGAQSALSLLAAKRLKLHPLFVLAGSHVSMWPLGPMLVIGSVLLGHACLGGPLPSDRHFNAIIASLHQAGTWRWMLADLVAGSVMLGTVLATLTYLLIRPVLSLAARRNVNV